MLVLFLSKSPTATCLAEKLNKNCHTSDVSETETDRQKRKKKS